MSFNYYTRPLAGSLRYTGQADYKGFLRTEEVVADLAQKTGLSAAQLETALRGLGEYVIDKCMEGWRIEPLFDLLGYNATCGGSHPTDNFFPSYENLAMDMRLRMGKDAHIRAKRNFTAECTGRHNVAVPRIVRVTNMHNKLPNCYTPGKPLQVEVEGGRVTMDTDEPNQGIFFRAANGTMVRAADYGYNRGTVFGCNVPLGLTGEQQLCICLEMYNSVRTGISPKPLTFSPLSDKAPAASPSSNGRGTSRGSKGTGKDIILPN